MNETLDQKERRLELARKVFQSLLIKAQKGLFLDDPPEKIQEYIDKCNDKLGLFIQETFAYVWEYKKNIDGNPISELEYLNYLEGRTEYDVFIVDKGNYDSGTIGTVQFKLKNIEINEPLIYRILVFTLQNSSSPIGEYTLLNECWKNDETKQNVDVVKRRFDGEELLFNDKKIYERLRSKLQKAISNLNNTILNECEQKYRLKKKYAEYSYLKPHPKYCILMIN